MRKKTVTLEYDHYEVNEYVRIKVSGETCVVYRTHLPTTTTAARVEVIKTGGDICSFSHLDIEPATPITHEMRIKAMEHPRFSQIRHTQQGDTMTGDKFVGREWVVLETNHDRLMDARYNDHFGTLTEALDAWVRKLQASGDI